MILVGNRFKDHIEYVEKAQIAEFAILVLLKNRCLQA